MKKLIATVILGVSLAAGAFVIHQEKVHASLCWWTCDSSGVCTCSPVSK